LDGAFDDATTFKISSADIEGFGVTIVNFEKKIFYYYY
jgi:hypothetical protein